MSLSTLDETNTAMVWVKGIVSAAIGAATGSVVAVISDPTTFNATPEGIKKVLTIAAISAIVAIAGYLKQSPIPGGK